MAEKVDYETFVTTMVKSVDLTADNDEILEALSELAQGSRENHRKAINETYEERASIMSH